MSSIVGIFPETCHNGLVKLLKRLTRIRLNPMHLVHSGIDYYD